MWGRVEFLICLIFAVKNRFFLLYFCFKSAV